MWILILNFFLDTNTGTVMSMSIYRWIFTCPQRWLGSESKVTLIPSRGSPNSWWSSATMASDGHPITRVLQWNPRCSTATQTKTQWCRFSLIVKSRHDTCVSSLRHGTVGSPWGLRSWSVPPRLVSHVKWSLSLHVNNCHFFYMYKKAAEEDVL